MKIPRGSVCYYLYHPSNIILTTDKEYFKELIEKGGEELPFVVDKREKIMAHHTEVYVVSLPLKESNDIRNISATINLDSKEIADMVIEKLGKEENVREVQEMFRKAFK